MHKPPATKRLTGFLKYLALARATIRKNLLTLPPALVWFLIRQMRYEKPTVWGDKLIINTAYTPLRSKSHETAMSFFSSAARGIARPLSVYFSVTNKCAFNCSYCSCFGSGANDLDAAIICRTIHQAQDAGAACIGFTGGEPLLRKDIEQFIAHVDERSYTLLFTSGHLLDKSRAHALKKAGLTAVVISLDSHIPQVHNFWRNSDAAFKKAVAAVQSCVNAGIYTALSMVVSKEMLSCNKMDEFIDFADTLGVQEIRMLKPKPCGRLMGRDVEMLDDADVRCLIDLQCRINSRPDKPTIMCLPHIGSRENYGCSAGRAHVYVSADGDVCPCDFVPLSFGNIADQTFEEVYKKMAACFPKPGYGCISNLTHNEIFSAAHGILPITDQAVIRDMLHLAENRPVPGIYKRLGYV